MPPLPQQALRFHAFADFAAGETGETHVIRIANFVDMKMQTDTFEGNMVRKQSQNTDQNQSKEQLNSEKIPSEVFLMRAVQLCIDVLSKKTKRKARKAISGDESQPAVSSNQ